MKFLYSIAIYLIAGPAIGCIIYFYYLNINKQDIDWHNFLYVFKIFYSAELVFVLYIIGAVPALASGILYQYPLHMSDSRIVRVVSATLIGAASNVAWVDYVIPGTMLIYGDSLGNVGLLGAAASFVCACLIEWISREADRRRDP